MDGALPAPAASALGLKPTTSLGDDPFYKQGIQRLSELGGERQKLQSDYEKESGAVETRLKAEQDKTAAMQPPKLENVPDKFVHKGMSPEELKDATTTLFTLAAIGGAMTRAPMTAALNAFSAGIKGLYQGDHEIFKRESEVFDRNFKIAIAKNREAMDEYKLAFDKHRGNISDLMNEWQIIAKKHGDSVSAVNMERQDIQGMLRQIEAMKRMDDNAEKTRMMFEQQTRRINETERNNRARLDAQAAHEANMRWLLEHKQSTGKLTESEAKSTTNWNEMHFANEAMTKLASEGITNIPISAQMLGRLYNPETGGWFASVQQEIRNSLTSKEEQRAFDAALAYTLAQAHAQGGARPSAYQVQMIWNAYIPMAGEDPETQLFKSELRANALESVKVSAGQGVSRLEAGRGQTGPLKEGEKSKSKSGRPIVVHNGQWHYDDGTPQ